jgi:hypothetical protein
LDGAERLVALWTGCVLIGCDLVALPECTASDHADGSPGVTALGRKRSRASAPDTADRHDCLVANAIARREAAGG